MKQDKKDLSTESLLKALEDRLEVIRKRQGPVPALPQEQFETIFRNQLRMRSAKR